MIIPEESSDMTAFELKRIRCHLIRGRRDILKPLCKWIIDWSVIMRIGKPEGKIRNYETRNIRAFLRKQRVGKTTNSSCFRSEISKGLMSDLVNGRLVEMRIETTWRAIIKQWINVNFFLKARSSLNDKPTVFLKKRHIVADWCGTESLKDKLACE